MHTATELLLSQPGVVFSHLARHAGHYATLTQLEAELAAGHWLRRAVAGAVALLAAAVAMVLAGVALMLAASPQAGTLAAWSWPWAYWAVPALPTLLALVAGAMALRRPAPAFEMLRQQLQQDLHLLAPAPPPATNADAGQPASPPASPPVSPPVTQPVGSSASPSAGPSAS